MKNQTEKLGSEKLGSEIRQVGLDLEEKLEIFETLLECEVLTESELTLVCHVAGNTLETARAVLYSKLGFNSLSHWKEEEEYERNKVQ